MTAVYALDPDPATITDLAAASIHRRYRIVPRVRESSPLAVAFAERCARVVQLKRELRAQCERADCAEARAERAEKRVRELETLETELGMTWAAEQDAPPDGVVTAVLERLAAERRRERPQPFRETYAELRYHCGLSDWQIAKRLGVANNSLLRRLHRHKIKPTPEFLTMCLAEKQARRA